MSTSFHGSTSFETSSFIVKARFFVVAGALASVLGCASTDSDGRSVTYSLTAKQNYEKGEQELKEENFIEASRFFSFVKQKFPFSRYAVLAELALADTRFSRGAYQEAIDSYQTFARLHPTHEKVEDGYVSYRIAQCYYREMPGDFFPLPPGHEKDQSSVRDAYRELSDFTDQFPDSEHLKEVKEFRRQVMARLIEHEVYVARFYLDTGYPKAAILRIRGAISRYPDSGREAELLLVLGRTHLEMGNPKTAKQTFERVVQEFGSALQAKRARLYIDFIHEQYGERPRDKETHG